MAGDPDRARPSSHAAEAVARVAARLGRRDLRVMFPMIAECAEFEAARAVLDLEIERQAKSGGTPPTRVLVGAMLEVPSLIWHLPALLPRLDFISVGSNDLMQYMFAADRGNPRINCRYDPLSPPMLNMFRHLVGLCDAAGVPLSVCGEMAGRPLDAMALIGIGFRSLSMSPPAVGAVKTMLRSLNVSGLSEYIETLYPVRDHSLREKLRAFAIDHGVMI